MPYENVIYEVDGHVASITMNRPDKLNALSEGLVSDIVAAVEEASADNDVRAVILKAAGRAFSAGYDISPGAEPWDEGLGTKFLVVSGQHEPVAQDMEQSQAHRGPGARVLPGRRDGPGPVLRHRRCRRERHLRAARRAGHRIGAEPYVDLPGRAPVGQADDASPATPSMARRRNGLDWS